MGGIIGKEMGKKKEKREIDNKKKWYIKYSVYMCCMSVWFVWRVWLPTGTVQQ
jgi:hypothetical protein